MTFRDIAANGDAAADQAELADSRGGGYRPAVIRFCGDGRRVGAGALIVATTTGLISGCAAGATTTSNPVGLTTFPAPTRQSRLAVHGTTLDGSSFSVRSLRGHVVVMNVWASWCRPCRTESGVMAASARRFTPAGVRFVGIDEHDDANSARSFSSAAGEHYPEVSDPDGEVLAQLPLLPQMGIPSTLILDRRGRPAARLIGPASRRVLDRAVRAVIGRR
jgi:thiol-disulfide isomerase/thioredoxin